MRVSYGFLLALCLLAAGCAAPAADVDPASRTPPLPVDGPTLAPNASMLLTASGYGFEPSIEVGPDGTIYVTAAQGVGKASRLWVSSDRGASFREVPVVDPESGVSNLPAGAEGDLAIGADGVAYYVELTLASTTVARSTDGGKTWELRTPAGFVVPGGDREWVAAGPKDTLALAWNNFVTGLWVAVSTDGGLTFPVQTHVAPPGAFSSGIAMGPQGEIYVARSLGEGVAVFVSTDGGKTFTKTVARETPNETNFIFAVPEVDAAGNAYVVWAEESEENVDVFYAWTADKGAAWSEPVKVSLHGGSSVLPWIDAGQEGHIAIAWYGAPEEKGNPSEVDAEWFPYVANIRNATGSTPDIQWGPVSEAPVGKGKVCTEGLACSGGRELGDYLQVALDPDGVPHVAFSTKERKVLWGLPAPVEML